MRTLSFLLFAILVALVSACPPLFAQGPPEVSCPLGAPDMTASIPQEYYTARPGEPVDVRIVVEPSELPPGFYLASLVTPLAWPEGGDAAILPGVPETTITASLPGEYVFRIMVNLVAKSSCAGAKAAPLTERTITVQLSD
jgi:hypothetical protein